MKIKFVELQNFRKLKSCRIDFAQKETVFVGANNSGKTSAMDALIVFLRRNSEFSTRDFTLSNWKEINKIGKQWVSGKDIEEGDLSIEPWNKYLPQLDVWIEVNEDEIHYINHLIPTLDWQDGLKVGDYTASVADYYSFDVTNPTLYETKLTIRPSGNPSGFNGSYWSSISNTGYDMIINAGLYQEMLFKRGAFEMARFTESGSLLLNTTTNNGYKLDVNGTSRFSSDVTIEGGLVFKQGNKTISITEANSSYQPVSINIGRTNTLNTNDNGRHITIGNNNTGNTSKIWQYMIGQGNNLSSAEVGNYAIGDYNSIVSGDTYQFIYGSGNTINYPWSSTSRGQFIIGNSNNVLHKYSSIMGNNQSTTGDNQLIFADGNSNSVSGGYRDVYFGSGPVSNLNTGVGAPVTVNSSGANGTDKVGGLLRLAAGKSTGSATASDIVFATASSSTSGTTLQSLTDRWYVKGESGQLANVSTPNASAIVDIQSTTQGVLLSRMTTTQRDAITAVEGLEIYNTTTHKKQVYDGTTWQDCW